MEQKAKNSGRFKRFFFRLIGPRRTENFLRSNLIKKYNTAPLQLPVNISTVHRVLCVLAKRPVDAIHQIGTILSLMALFKQARMTLLCTPEISRYIKNIPGADIVEYDQQASPIFSLPFETLATALHGEIDICIVLDPDPGIALLYLAGRTAATIRAGFENSGAWPFLNFKMKASSSPRFRAEWFRTIAVMFGVQPAGEIKWSVSRETVEEMKQEMTDAGIRSDRTAIGVDLPFFERLCGARWCDSFVTALRQAVEGPLFIFTETPAEKPQNQRSIRTELPAITTATIPRITALASLSKLLITGNTVLCALSGMIDAQLIGVFEEKEMTPYCPDLPNVAGIAFNTTPDTATIQAITSAIVEGKTATSK